MARLGLFGLLSIAVVGGLSASNAIGGGNVAARPSARVTIGPTRLLSPRFGYAVAYRTVERGVAARTELGLFVYSDGRWRNATPPQLAADGADLIDDVVFVDRRHGWVAAYNCANVAVFLYRTGDGGRSWHSQGKPASHSCGGGPTFLSFVDREHGWMEPVSPNGPTGVLLRTTNGGQTWARVASGPPGQVPPPALPCLAPIRFVSVSSGWMGRCQLGGVFSTVDAGHRWRRVPVGIRDRANARFDLPTFAGRTGVVAATLGTRPKTESGWTRTVAFAVSRDGGRTWTARSTRRIASCPLGAYSTLSWPVSVADERVWWIVSGRTRPLVQVTNDGGRTWLTTAARGLPTRSCSVLNVSAADRSNALVVARRGLHDSALFQSADGGRHWKRVILLGR